MFRYRTSDNTTRSLLDRAARASPTYDETGATRADALPAGYAHDRYRVGLGPNTFERACDGLRAWQAHLGAGVDVYPRDAPLEPGTNVIVIARVGPLHALAPCRIVYAIDERDRFGFAYGTLPGHPERGEEAFIVERSTDGGTTFSIVAFSRPEELVARVGKPFARRIQRRTTRAYLDALARSAAS